MRTKIVVDQFGIETAVKLAQIANETKTDTPDIVIENIDPIDLTSVIKYAKAVVTSKFYEFKVKERHTDIMGKTVFSLTISHVNCISGDGNAVYFEFVK